MEEAPERVEAIELGMVESGLREQWVEVPITPIEPSDLQLVHSQEYVETLSKIQNYQSSSEQFLMGNYANHHTYDAVMLSAGSVCNAVSAVCSGTAASAFVNCRPPGHHSGANWSSKEGYCYVNNVALAARYAQQNHGVSKVAILDWDVHFGNGTYDIFKDDDSVLFCSMHRYDAGNFYPYLPTGGALATGTDAKGYNINIPWNTGLDKTEESPIGDGDYTEAFDQWFMPILSQFKPDLTIVSCGFDAMHGDPLGKLQATPSLFAYMTSQLMQWGTGKLVLALEGGYNLQNLQSGSQAVVEALLGKHVEMRTNKDATEIGSECIQESKKVAYEYWEIPTLS